MQLKVSLSYFRRSKNASTEQRRAFVEAKAFGGRQGADRVGGVVGSSTCTGNFNYSNIHFNVIINYINLTMNYL